MRMSGRRSGLAQRDDDGLGLRVGQRLLAELTAEPIIPIRRSDDSRRAIGVRYRGLATQDGEQGHHLEQHLHLALLERT